MKKFFKKSFLSVLVLTLLLSFSNIQKVSAQQKQLPKEQIMEIVNSHVKKVWQGFYIENENELVDKIGVENVDSLKKQLKKQNELLALERNRNAVSNIHIFILRYVGAKVETHWWGTRIKTSNKETTIQVRKAAEMFSSSTSTAGFITGLATIGIAFIPGVGNVAAIAGLLVSAISWSDAETWSDVASKIADKGDYGIYNLTIDINAWYKDVRVY